MITQFDRSLERDFFRRLSTRYLSAPCRLVVQNDDLADELFYYFPVYKISESENYNMVPRNLLCYENMVIVTHSVMWWNDDCPSQHDSFEAIHRLCDGRHFCSVNHTRSALGDPCPAEMPWERLYFEMQYSCQSGKEVHKQTLYDCYTDQTRYAE